MNVLNLGAGVQSTTVYLLALEGRVRPIDHAVFADTQEEPQAVYAHLDWLKSLGGPPILVRTRGKLGNDLLRGVNATGGRFVSIPAYTRAAAGAIGTVRRQCTKEYKVEVVQRTIRELLGLPRRGRYPKNHGVEQTYGISVDEAGRALGIRQAFHDRPHRGTPLFPLLELGWTRRDCEVYLVERVPHQVPRSACVFCPFKSDAEWLRLKRDDTVGWARAVEIDEGLRRPGIVLARKVDNAMFLHRSARPLAGVAFGLERQHEFPGFAVECEGMCGV